MHSVTIQIRAFREWTRNRLLGQVILTGSYDRMVRLIRRLSRQALTEVGFVNGVSASRRALPDIMGRINISERQRKKAKSV
jgi:hypothetical protein